VGTLTTDGARVYVVEDLMVPPYEHPDEGTGVRPIDKFPGKLGDMIHHNRLQAYDGETGKLMWEAGSRGDPKERDKPDDKFALTDTYFRSAPLPLGDSLWVLVERRQVLYLAQLEPKTGKLRGEPLKLCEYRDRMPQSIHRRIHAAHLAVADGVFVCPTG